MREVLQFNEDRIKASNIIQRLNLQEYQYIVASIHREENVDDTLALANVVEILNSVAENLCLPIVFSTHPRTRKRLEKEGKSLHRLIQMHKPFAFTDYIALQKSASLVLSDSGTISEEASLLNLRALNIREAQERHEAIDEAVVMFVGRNLERVHQGIAIIKSQAAGEPRTIRQVNDYLADNVSEKVIRIIHSYVDFINREIWKK
jgi:UDP-N-acetylglucosamine 2-epimerase (non-hydrolysing)